MRVCLMKEEALELQDLLADLETIISNVPVEGRYIAPLQRAVEKVEARRLMLTKSIDEAGQVIQATEILRRQCDLSRWQIEPYFRGIKDLLKGEADLWASLYGVMAKVRDADKPYGISPGPGACCPDCPSCKHNPDWQGADE